MRNTKHSIVMVGKTARKNRKDNGDLYTNAELLETVKEAVRFQFGDRPTFIINAPSVLSDLNRYPGFYAATWLTNTDTVDGQPGCGSELVIIEHGNTMEAAQKSLLEVIETLDWDSLASNINV